MHIAQCIERSGRSLGGGMLAAYVGRLPCDLQDREARVREHQVRTATGHPPEAPHRFPCAESMIGN